MKILVITDLYPIREDEPFTPRTIYDFVQEWKNQGHEVRIIKPNFILNSILRRKPFYKSKIYGEVENINYWLPFCGKILNKCKTLKYYNPDLVIAHMPSGIIFANKIGLEFSAAVHCSDIEVLTNPLYGIYFKKELEKGYKNSKKIACRSDVLKNKFLKLYPEYKDKTFTAFSGIKFEPVKKEWQNNSKIKIVTCAQLIKRKNIDKVINACSELENVELTVIGAGKEKTYLEKLSPKTIFTGQLPHKNVLEIMKKSDIFVLPSQNETFGMVYLEAMGCGCITICAKNDGIDGIIEDGVNGFLTTPSTVKETLLKIINLPDKNEILRNTYSTILNYTGKKAAQNYLDNISNT